MACNSTVQKYILLPPRGLRPPATGAAPSAGAFLRSLARNRPADGLEADGPRAPWRVLDSIGEDGARLVEMTPEAVREVRAAAPGLRVVPLVYYRKAIAPRPTAVARPRAAARRRASRVALKVVSRADNTPVAGAFVVAFTDFANRVGAQGTTGADGRVGLDLGAARAAIERLYVYPDRGFWGALRQGIPIRNGTAIGLDPIDLSAVDGLRNAYGRAPLDAGAGLTVGVVDSGIDTQHPDLTVSGGQNTVNGEDPDDFGDNGGHHGTHVGGIIAAHGTPPTGIRGQAPGVTLRSYRVFGKDAEGASNFAIAKAIDAAVADGCDLINMSLGGGPGDDATRSAIADARAKGVLVIVAAGNDDRSPVSFPASDPRALAISALGRLGTFPGDAVESGDVAPPSGADKADFIAGFSNIGPEIALTGPGVGVISTVPGGFAIMSGTSMACPAVTGAAARLLARPASRPILAMPRDQDRSDAMARALLTSAQSLGFGPEYQGHGLPRIGD